MKIVHFSGGTLEGGAAQGALRLHWALRERGVDSHFYIQRGNPGDGDTSPLTATKFQKLKSSTLGAIDQAFVRPYRGRPNMYFSPALVGQGISRLPAVHEADLIHLHWTCNGMLSIGQIARLRKPVVWTMRDMWPFTGGCHYSYDCTGYSAHCGRCPELASDYRLDLSRFVLHRKVHAYRSNIHFVAISRWLAEAARRSAPLAGREIVVIPNSVDVRRYLPVERDTARRVLGLPADARIIVFGALAATTDSRKGFNYLIQIAERLQNEDTVFLVFGAFGNERLSQAARGRVHFLGTLRDSLSLNLAYAAGDVFVAPSLQEAFGKTVIEAMASGTPVVAFETIGAGDIIDHRVDGYLAAHGSADDLISGIEWTTADADRAARMRHMVREKVIRSVSDDVIARRYLDFYRNVLDKQASS